MNMYRHYLFQCFLFFGAAALFCLPAIIPAGAGYAVEIPKAVFVHQQAEFFSAGQPIAVKADIDNSGPLLAARCYFRFRSDTGYLYIDLENRGDDYLGLLPAPGPRIDSVAYFFLVVNEAGQVLRSPVYTSVREENGKVAAPLVPERSHFALKTEIPSLPAAPEDLFWHPDQVEVSAAGRNERYGLAAGLYQPDDFPEAKAIPGYFGGFIMATDGQALPVEGLMLQSVTPTLLDQFQDSQTDEPLPEPVERVGPDIRGRWTGGVYIDDGGIFTFFGFVTVDITHVGDAVTMTTSYPQRPQYLTGTINEDGYMLLYDEWGEDWTTFYGPATETALTIADFLRPPSTEEPRPPLLVLDLKRKKPPVPLPVIYDLLLPPKAM